MPQFVMIGWDGPDGADRRDASRTAHIDHVTKLYDDGIVLLAGPIRDEAGENSVGVVILFEAPNLAEARALVQRDPYVAADVFESIEVRPFKQVFPPKP